MALAAESNAGADRLHLPVMLAEVRALLREVERRLVVDATLGQWMLANSPRFLLLPPMIFAAHKWLAHLREENEYKSELIFEDLPEPALELLNLSRN